MRKYLLAVLLALVVVLVPLYAAIAATTQNVTINATPAFVSITNAPDNYSFGVVQTSTNYSTSTPYFNLTNDSTVNVDISVGTNNTEWVGGTAWTHSETGFAGVGADTAALQASPDTAGWDTIVKNASPNDLWSNESGSSLDWELRLCSPTSFSDGTVKAIQVVLTASAT